MTSTRKTEVTVKGKVFSGLGEGEFYVNLYARNFRKILGLTPYPGTLNVRVIPEHVRILNERLKEANPIIIPPPQVQGLKLGKVYLFKAFLFDITVYVVRPEYTVYKGDVVELISEEHLRNKYGINDGDIVEITV